MVFRLKNGRATYQKYVHIILENQIGRNIDAYIDDIVVKSKKLDDLKETFDNLRKFKMMLNPKKNCVWCVIRETARLHGVVLGNRCEPHQGESHRKIATT
jgi:predicted transcriptional regulator